MIQLVPGWVPMPAQEGIVRMSNGSKGTLGTNLTTILVALLGTISAIGAAWITTYGPRSADPAPAAAMTISTAIAQPSILHPQASGISASASPAADPTVPHVVIPTPADTPAQPVAATAPAAPAFLPNSQHILYNQPWPNDQRGTSLILEAVEVADQVVRVHLRFENTSNGPITFYTATRGRGITSAISDKKGPKSLISATGGDLFADPTVVEIPAGGNVRGWLEYTLRGKKLSSLTLSLETYTEGYPADGSGTITYEPLTFNVEQ